jgi:hypothetical protein
MSQVEKEGLFLRPPGGAIDRGKIETRHAVTKRNLRGKGVTTDVDIGHIHLGVLPEQDDPTSSPSRRFERKFVELVSSEESCERQVDELELSFLQADNLTRSGRYSFMHREAPFRGI